MENANIIKFETAKVVQIQPIGRSIFADEVRYVGERFASQRFAEFYLQGDWVGSFHFESIFDLANSENLASTKKARVVNERHGL